jgi:hypothetical protein
MTNKTIATTLGVIVVVIIAGVLINNHRNSGSVVGDTNSTSTVANSNSTSSTSGDQTNTGTIVTPGQAGKPIVVTNASVAPSDTTAVVSGKVTPNGATTNYWYEYGNTSTLGSKTSNQSIGSGYIAISAPAYITGLTKNTTYYFRLVAENSMGRIVGAQYSFQTTNGVAAPIGGVPTVKTLAANTISQASATLHGEITPNRAATEYWFEYGKTTSLGATTNFASAGSGTGIVSASTAINNLEAGTTYYFRLNAQNQFGTVLGPVLSFKTSGTAATATAPAVDTGTATAIRTTEATLRGTVDANGMPTTYWFEYSADSLLGSVLLHSTAQQSAGTGTNSAEVAADITGLTSNTTYYFRIVAQNSLGTVRGDRETFKTK